jgi:hypothetical protein
MVIPQSSVAPLNAPERPITELADDRLGRGPFLERLCDALINPNTKASTGVVIGISGPWGSGKSSLLNLLHKRIKQRYRDAVVVRFNPWLISARDDLIGDFITEVVAELNEELSGKERLKAAMMRLADYASIVAPAANIKLPGIGSILHNVLSRLQNWFRGDDSLRVRQDRVVKALAGAGVPIVAMIDEVDRLEDQEIRTVAQLVRSVADFPGLSYVLAYDTERVIQALSGDDSAHDRGRAYLEKIVQFQLSLPIALDEEIRNLIDADLAKLVAQKLVPENWRNIQRYQDLVNILVPSIISTPRDVKRLVGTFHVLAGMVASEVNWIDLLGFCTLHVKAPRTIERIRRRPEFLVTDPNSVNEWNSRAREDDQNVENRRMKINPDDEGGAPISSLLLHLFPRLASRDGKLDEERPNAIYKRRPLLTALRLNLLPGHFSKDEIVRLFSVASADVQHILHEAYSSDRLGFLIDRIGDMLHELPRNDRGEFWHGVSKFFEKPDCEWMRSYVPIHEFARAFEEIFFRMLELGQVQGVASVIFQDMVDRGDVLLASYLLRSNIFAHGLFGQERSDHATFLARDATERLAKELSTKYRERHLKEQFVPCLWSLMPVYTMVDTGIWDQECRTHLTELLADPVALGGFVLMTFGGAYFTGRDMLDRIVNYERFSELVQQHLASSDIGAVHETVQVALRKVGKW